MSKKTLSSKLSFDRHVAASLCISVALVVAAGCGAPEPIGPPRYATRGVISYDGKPVANAQVVFHAPDLGISRGAFTNEVGEFTVIATSGEGLPAGEYTVVVRPAPGGDEEIIDLRRPELPDKYRRQKTSDLKFTIQAAENELQIELAPKAP